MKKSQMINDILKTCKINHYIKNLVVIIPLILSTEFLDIKSCLMSLIAFVVFCFASSAVYIMNDIIDIEKDRLHPIKCNRPIASGRISKPFALFILFILLALCIATSLFFTNMYCLFAIAGYFVLNIFYSLYLKNIPIVDMASIALGFILRVIAGCAVISVNPSPLIIILTFFASMFFTSAKRKLEFQMLLEGGGKNQ